MSYQVIDNVKVWGTPDEGALKQAVRCSQVGDVAGVVLCADHHLGYSQPIGGVVAYRGMVSPSGVGYDIACLAAGTEVSTSDGYWLPIEGVKALDTVTCWDGEQMRRVSPSFGSVSKGMKPLKHLTLSNGRTVRATADHLILTRRGWTEVASLSNGDLVACVPFKGVRFSPQTGELPIILHTHRHIEELKAKGLYPVHCGSTFFPILIRLAAYICGDGHLSKDGKRISLYTTNGTDARHMSEDFSRLGYLARTVIRDRHPNRKPEHHIYVSSTSLHALFAGFGCPVGKKEWPEQPLPWLFAMEPWVRAHFLSSFCSAEMMTPRMGSGRTANLQLKQAGDTPNAIHFVARLLTSMGFQVSVAKSGPARGERQDYVLQILGGESEQIRFVEEIGFCYAREKRIEAANCLSVAWGRKVFVQNREAAYGEAIRLKAAGMKVRDIVTTIANGFEVPKALAFHAMYGRNVPRSAKGARFSSETTKEICWIPIDNIAEGEPAPVYDIATDDPAHCFFANGVVAHNCGNKAVRTDTWTVDARADIGRIMDEIARTISFGVGRKNATPVDHELFDDPTWTDIPEVGRLKRLAAEQLGTVGSGNHYVDLFEEQQSGVLWVGCHFGSRGFGHKIASGFLNLAAGRKFDDRAPGESMDQDPTLISLDTELGQSYMAAMTLAGRYAYAGRDYVIDQVLKILGVKADFEVHNHHNYAWVEEHGGEKLAVVRKGATPLAPGQLGFVGGSMGDISVIIRGVESQEAKDSFYSTVHGAGRIMSRTQAAGKMNWKTRTRSGGRISPEQMQEAVKAYGVTLRGAGTDESPFAYRKLADVLEAHKDTLEVLHVLKPFGVAMAGGDEFDPYKD